MRPAPGDAWLKELGTADHSERNKLKREQVHCEGGEGDTAFIEVSSEPLAT